MGYEYKNGMGQFTAGKLFSMDVVKQSAAQSGSSTTAPSTTGWGSGYRPPAMTTWGKTSPYSSSSSSGLVVPSTVPRTGIMPVTKDGKKYVVVTKNTRLAKIAALKKLGTNQGMSLATKLNNSQFRRCPTLDGITAATDEVKSFTGQHALTFCGGSAYNKSTWDQVQALLNKAHVIVPKPINLVIAATNQAEENLNQANDVAKGANQQVDDLNAQDFAQDAEEQASDAEDVFNAVAPWYRRYALHVGIGAALLAAAGGGYLWWKNRSKEITLNPLPAPKSPRHPAGF